MDAFLMQYIDPYYLRILVLIGINIILALGLNITTGVTGQLSMGHAGFMSLELIRQPFFPGNSLLLSGRLYYVVPW